MAKTSTWIPITTLVFLLLMISSVSATTDASDVSALHDLYKTLAYPPQLTGWKTKGEDPCVEQWKGVICDGSSVLYIKLNGLDLGGYLGEQLNLMNLKQLDLSSNHIQGAIPSLLPPNATHIDLSCNKFNMSIPYTLTSMKHLSRLNFSHNALSGPVGNVFTGLHNLKQMDLSFNAFTGDLPSSFGNLSDLSRLYLQNNKFTGSVKFLANLPLIELDVQNNHFTGVVPKQFKFVHNIRLDGNEFQLWTVEYLLQRFRAVKKGLFVGGNIVVAFFGLIAIALHPMVILLGRASGFEVTHKVLMAVLVILHFGEFTTEMALDPNNGLPADEFRLISYRSAKLLFSILAAFVTYLSLRKHRSHYLITGFEFYFAFYSLAHSICAFLSEALETNVLHNSDHFAICTIFCAYIFDCMMFYFYQPPQEEDVRGLHLCPHCGHTE